MTAAATSSAWSRSAASATRRWVALPVLLALLGLLAGLLAGAAAKPSAEALLLVQSTSTDGTGMERDTENAALELSTNKTFQAAGEALGIEAADLFARSEITSVPNSQIISITVTADSEDIALQDADALAQAGITLGPDRLEASLEQLTDSTRELINSQQLPNSSAERARVARLGDELAAGQAALITDANSLALLQEAQPTSRLPGRPVLAAMGALAGLLLGIGAALLLGARRGTVKSESELAELYPRTAVIRPSDLRSVMEMETSTSTVIVAGTRGTKMGELTESVRASISESTNQPVVLTRSLADAPANEAPNGHINLVSTTLSETVLRRARTDSNAILIVPVLPRVTRLEAVDAYASRLNERSYLLFDERAPEWH